MVNRPAPLFSKGRGLNPNISTNILWKFCAYGRAMRLAAVAMCLIGGCAARTAIAEPARTVTHEDYVEQVNRAPTFDVMDKRAVFAVVFNNLADRVKVYPTENYYYFKFLDRGAQFTGNIRLETATRDQGKLHFSYSMEFTPWLPDARMFHDLLDRSDGVAVERVDLLTYRVTFGGKNVIFALNDLSKVKPPAGMLTSNERLIGPILDDSAVRFFLVYNSALKQFLFLLDELEPASDVLAASGAAERILIGRRTGFAYYKDHLRDRKILIGVYGINVDVNNALDGPFDQLPDNFIEGEGLRSAILEVEPKLTGKIDRLGNSFDGESRYLIAPYLEYIAPSELLAYDRCARRRQLDQKSYYRCFVDVGRTPRR